MGWVVGPKPLIAALRTMHAYATFCAPTPLQLGVAAALTKIADDADAAARSRSRVGGVALAGGKKRFFFRFRNETPRGGFRVHARVSRSGLGRAGHRVERCRAVARARGLGRRAVRTLGRVLFLAADVASTGLAATEYCRALATGPARVAAVPMDVFFDAKDSAKDVPRNLVRFAVCKSSETIGKCAEAIRNNPPGAGARKEL